VAGLAGHADQWQRRWHHRLVGGAETALAKGDEGALGRAVALSAAMTFFRGAAVVAISLVLLPRPMAFLLSRLALPAREALEWIYWLGLLLGFVAVLDHFWERRWIKIGAASFLVSALAIYGMGYSSQRVLGLAAGAALVSAVILERRLRA
jgi:hypothetical protein